METKQVRYISCPVQRVYLVGMSSLNRALYELNEEYLIGIGMIEAPPPVPPKRDAKPKPTEAPDKVCPKKEKRAVWLAYKAEVWRITEEQPLHLLDNFDKRGFTEWHVDHILSVCEGFHLGLPADTVGHISNLRMLHWRDNIAKNTRRVYTDLFGNDV